MPKEHEIYIDYLTNTFGQEDDIFKHDAPDGGPPVSVFVYRDAPSPGMITGVTYGLSWCDHPDWKLARPELIVSVHSSDTAWPLAAAYFAAEFRGQKRFCYGDVFTTDAPLSGDTQMDGFLLFAQSVLETGESVNLGRYKVHLSQLYPIYRSELKLYEQLGLEGFWKHPDFDIGNVRRKPMA